MKSALTYGFAACILLGAAACGSVKSASETGNGGSTSVANAVTVSGTTLNTKLGNALFQTSATDPGPKKYTLSMSDYDPCVWAQDHDAGLFPKNSDLLGLYLLDQTGGTVNTPNPGTYQVQTPAPGSTGQFIDPKVSGFGAITDCVGNWPGLASGTVTLTQVNNGAAIGSLNLVLADGTKIVGSFGTKTCTGNFTQSPPANDPAACTTIK